ncbi:MAG TPA: hypothetical protein VGG09_02820, partial [Acidimicrobiales bacterium]
MSLRRAGVRRTGGGPIPATAATMAATSMALLITLCGWSGTAAATTGSTATSHATTSLSAAQSLARAEVSYYTSQLPAGTQVNCVAPAGNPPFPSAAWELRDLENEVCATGRLTDE